MPDATDLDHVAIASEHALDNFVRYRGDLGGAWVAGAYDPGFYWGQVRFANGMTLEMLEPANVHEHDFLRRFLDANGPGPHHVTFKVPDIHAAIDAVTTAGYPPVAVNTASEFWKEAFLHPKQAHGIVVQLAQAAEHEHPPQFEMPPPRVDAPASFDRVVHLVADLDAALGLFRDTLGGAECDGDDTGVELAWPGPGRVRLAAARDDAERAWVGTRPGRVHHLAFSLADPAAVPDAAAIGDGEWEVAPERNLGVRLRLRAT